MYSVRQAAQRLAVNPARIRALIAAGELSANNIDGRWLVHRASLEHRARRASAVSPGVSPRGRRHVTAEGRPFSERTAWAVLLGPDHAFHEGMSRQQRHRLEKCLDGRAIDVAKLRRRAMTACYEMHPSMAPHLLADRRLTRTGASAAAEYGADVVADRHVEAYVRQQDHDAVAREYALATSGQPNVVLRIVNGPWPFATDSRVAPVRVVCVDLLDSSDPRDRRAAEGLGVAGFTSKYFKILGRRGNWIRGQWSDGGLDEIKPEALRRAIENGTDVRHRGRMLRPNDVAELVSHLQRTSA